MRLVLACSLLLAMSLYGERSAAQTVQQQAEAHARFEDAMTLMQRRKFEDACTLFEESLELAMDMTTAFRLAECYEQIGKLGPAWHYYSEVAEAADSAGMAERRDYAKKRAESLAPKLARLRVEVPEDVAAIEALEIAVDGRELSQSLWNRDLAVDSGSHEISAEAPEHQPWSDTIEVDRKGPTLSVTVSLRKIVRPPPPQSKTESAWVPPPTIGIVLTSVGAAGVLTGIIVGAVAKSHHDDSLAFCADRACTDEGLEMQDQAIDEGDAATVVFSIGAIVLAAGGGFLLWSYLGPKGNEVAVGPGWVTLRY